MELRLITSAAKLSTPEWVTFHGADGKKVYAENEKKIELLILPASRALSELAREAVMPRLAALRDTCATCGKPSGDFVAHFGGNTSSEAVVESAEMHAFSPSVPTTETDENALFATALFVAATQDWHGVNGEGGPAPCNDVNKAWMFSEVPAIANFALEASRDHGSAFVEDDQKN